MIKRVESVSLFSNTIQVSQSSKDIVIKWIYPYSPVDFVILE